MATVTQSPKSNKNKVPHRADPVGRNSKASQHAPVQPNAKRPRPGPAPAAVVQSAPRTEAQEVLRFEVRRNNPFLAAYLFALFGFGVATVSLLMFGLDLALAWPLRRASPLFDITSVIGGTILAYLSWEILGDLPKWHRKKHG